jgi:acyl carrier protein
MTTPRTETFDALTDRVMKIAGEQVALSKEQVSLDSSFMNDLGYDSLDVMEFVMEVEDEFQVSVPDDVVQRISTVRQAVDEIRRLIEVQNRTRQQ